MNHIELNKIITELSYLVSKLQSHANDVTAKVNNNKASHEEYYTQMGGAPGVTYTPEEVEILREIYYKDPTGMYTTKKPTPSGGRDWK